VPALNDQPGQATLSARAGDVVLLDYRLLHGTPASWLAELPSFAGTRVDLELNRVAPARFAVCG
jgi:hypothetical protein